MLCNYWDKRFIKITSHETYHNGLAFIELKKYYHGGRVKINKKKNINHRWWLDLISCVKEMRAYITQQNKYEKDNLKLYIS